MNTNVIKEKTEMLEEYFGIHIDPDGNLSRLPIVLDQYTPDMDRVPELILCLGNDVSFTFLEKISSPDIADFYYRQDKLILLFNCWFRFSIM